MVVAQLGEAIPDMIDFAIIWSMVRECERLFNACLVLSFLQNSFQSLFSADTECLYGT